MSAAVKRHNGFEDRGRHRAPVTSDSTVLERFFLAYVACLNNPEVLAYFLTE